jgi:DNA-directed RNA polymerase specialized sigma24 family protein
VVLRAKYLDRRTVDEIAADQGLTPKAAESLLGRARQAFREAFEADHD